MPIWLETGCEKHRSGTHRSTRHKGNSFIVFCSVFSDQAQPHAGQWLPVDLCRWVCLASPACLTPATRLGNSHPVYVKELHSESAGLFYQRSCCGCPGPHTHTLSPLPTFPSLPPSRWTQLICFWSLSFSISPMLPPGVWQQLNCGMHPTSRGQTSPSIPTSSAHGFYHSFHICHFVIRSLHTKNY